METAKEMRARHERELEELQEQCLHPKVSDWLLQEWAPGHFVGEVKICELCEKVLAGR